MSLPKAAEPITIFLEPADPAPLPHVSSLQHIYDTAPIGLAFLSPDCRYLQINQRLTEICGLSVEDHLGRTVRECVPALADAVENIVRTMLKNGKPITGIEIGGQRADQGEARFWITYWHPVYDANRKIIGINVAAEEITERKRAEAALRVSEQQFRTLADSIPQLVWMSHADGTIFWFNHQLSEFAQLSQGNIRGHDWLAVLRPDKGRDEWDDRLKAGAPFEMELELYGPAGEPRAFLTRIVPLRDGGGIYRWIGTHIDISEQKRREEHVRTIRDELSHRTKNLLAVVMAMARQTSEHVDSVDQYHSRFIERVAALAHSHALLARDSWYGSSFADLVAAQLKPFGEVSQGRIDADGPPLVLNSQEVQYLGLALHELATNACKHGALAGPNGQVSILWLLDEAERQIQLNWRERDGPLVHPPQRRGFGHVLIEQIVPRALRGSGALDFAPEGVNWRFEFPAGGT